MKTLIDANYTVSKTLKLSEFLSSSEIYYYDYERPETDVFNKQSRTTVCFDGALGSKVMYCENCEETHYNHMECLVELREYDVKSLSEDERKNVYSYYTSKDGIYKKAIRDKVICEKCGSIYNADDIRIINRFGNPDNSDTRVVHDTVFIDDEYVKMSLKLCSMVVERAFYSVDNIYKIIFNTRTGQTYIYENPINKKNKVRPVRMKRTLENTTFNSTFFDNLYGPALVDDENPKEYKLNKIKGMYDVIYEKISSNLGYSPKTLKDYAEEVHETREDYIYTFSNIAIYNRFPNLNPFILKKLDELSYSIGKVNVLNKLRKIKNTSENPLLELSKLYKIGSFELFEKYYKEASPKLYWFIYFSMFFKDTKKIEELISIYDGQNVLTTPRNLDILIKRKYSLENSVTYFFKNALKVMNEDNIYHILKQYISNYNLRIELDNIFNIYYLANRIDKNVDIDTHYISNLLCGIVNGLEYEPILNKVKMYIFEKLNEFLWSKNSKKFSYKIKKLNEYYKEFHCDCGENNMLISSIYNAIPNFNPYMLAEMFYGNKVRNVYHCELAEEFDIKNYLDEITDDTLGDIFKKYNIPSVKSYRAKILDKPHKFKALMFYSNIFSDINAVNNILNSFNNSTVDDYEIYELNEFLLGKETPCKYANIGYEYKFLKKLVELQGETIASRKVALAYKNNTYQYASDIWSMYEIHERLYPDREVDFTGNIKEIHDRLITLTGGAHNPFTKEELKPFKYTDEDGELEFEEGKYSFKLPYDARELALIGSDLKNCVRGYVNRVHDKSCIIVAVSYENEYKICVELRKSLDNSCKYTLHQAKLYNNTEVSKDCEALDIVLKWMELKSIKDKSTDIVAYKDNFHNNLDNNLIENIQFNNMLNEYEFDYYENAEDVPF